MSLDMYEKVKSIVEKETKLLNESGIITEQQKKDFNGEFVSYNDQKNYIDVDPPPTSNEYSHGIYNRPKNYLNKKLLNSPNGKIFIKTQNNLYLEYDDNGQIKLVNIENIENKDNIIWSFMGGNSDHMRFVSKDGAFIKVNSNYSISIPVLQNNKEDIKSPSNLWKILRKDDSYLIESIFYKSHYLDHNLRITEGISDAKKWILEPVPITNTVTYVDITKELMDEKSTTVDRFINLNNQIKKNIIVINYLTILKDKLAPIYNKYSNSKLKNTNNTTIRFNGDKNIGFIKSEYVNNFNRAISKLESINKNLQAEIIKIKETKLLEEFEEKLEDKIISLQETLSNIQYDNNYISGNIFKNLDNIENTENNLNYVQNRALILDDNYDIIKKNNRYLKRRRYFLMMVIFIFGVVLISLAVTIINDIYKILNYMN